MTIVKTKLVGKQIVIRHAHLRERSALMHALTGLQDKFYVIDSIITGSTMNGGICFHHGTSRGEQQFVHQVVEAFIPERYGARKVNVRTQMYSLDGHPVENFGQFDRDHSFSYGYKRDRIHVSKQEYVVNEFTLEEFLEIAKPAPKSFKPK